LKTQVRRLSLTLYPNKLQAFEGFETSKSATFSRYRHSLCFSVNNGIASVTHVGYDIEAPDYDHRGHFYPNVHEEDVEEEVESRFPHASQRDLIDAVVEDHYHRQQEHFPIGRRVHYHTDDDDDDR